MDLERIGQLWRCRCFKQSSLSVDGPEVLLVDWEVSEVSLYITESRSEINSRRVKNLTSVRCCYYSTETSFLRPRRTFARKLMEVLESLESWWLFCGGTKWPREIIMVVAPRQTWRRTVTNGTSKRIKDFVHRFRHLHYPNLTLYINVYFSIEFQSVLRLIGWLLIVCFSFYLDNINKTQRSGDWYYFGVEWLLLWPNVWRKVLSTWWTSNPFARLGRVFPDLRIPSWFEGIFGSLSLDERTKDTTPFIENGIRTSWILRWS